MKPASPLRLAIIGCGAITEAYHLPALARHASLLQRLVLVDPDVTRARTLAGKYAVEDVAESHESILDRIDAAIVAAPPSLHARIAMPLLARGVHVLCEKPLAESSVDALAMTEQAERSRVCLCVNNTRRMFAPLIHAKQLLDSGVIGECVSIEYAEGSRFTWPTVSGFHFARTGAAKGVLLDQGAHVLDTICWWLGEKPAVVSCRTDSFGGPEGVALVVLRTAACTVNIKLSWLSTLSNSYRIVGRRGFIEGEIWDWRRLKIAADGARPRHLHVGSTSDYQDFGHHIIDNFLDAIQGRTATALITARAVLPSIRLLEECYRCATRLPMPWLETLPRVPCELSA
jgi:predicted dehydrogenase